MEIKTVLSSIDNKKIHTYIWACNNPIGIVQIAHGMGEHAYRYNDFANFLNSNNFIVIASDHRGHGKTAINESEFGHFADNNGWEIAVNDLLDINTFIITNFPNLPVCLFGHSMGSFLARTFAIKYSKTINALILCGTGSYNSILLQIGKSVLKLVMLIKGNQAKVNTINNIALKSFNRKIKKPITHFDWVSTDKKTIKKIETDAYCFFKFSLAFYFDLLTGIHYINSNYKNTNKQLPIYLFSGTEDPVGNYSKGVKKAYLQYKKNGNKSIEIDLYNNMRHEPLHEIEKDTVYKNFLNKLNSFILK